MKKIIPLIIVAVALIGAVLLFSRGGGGDIKEENVSVVDGIQIIDLRARGGYMPRRSIAKAGIPTVLRVSTNGTFDCSSAIRIPTLGISKNLPYSGETDIELGSPQSGIMKGTCAMGMYPFEIDFQI